MRVWGVREGSLDLCLLQKKTHHFPLVGTALPLWGKYIVFFFFSLFPVPNPGSI